MTDLWSDRIDGGRSVARLASVHLPPSPREVGVDLISHLFDIKVSALDKDLTVTTPISMYIGNLYLI